MTTVIPWLSLIAFVPLVGAIVTFGLRGRAAKIAGMVFALATLVIAILTVVSFSSDWQAVSEHLTWVPKLGLSYALGLDGMGAVMV